MPMVAVMFAALTSVALTSVAPVDSMCRPDRDGPAVPVAGFPIRAHSPYILPFRPGRAFLIWRTTSHYAPGNGGVGLYAIDIEMPVGTPLVAVRAGTVVAVRDSFADGNDTDLQENYVMIRHSDSTVARYIHLTRRGARVRVGEVVSQGQLVALSGNSGQTGGPHLHFDVQRCGPNLPPAYNALPCGQTVPVAFSNAGENRCGLIPGRRYRAVSAISGVRRATSAAVHSRP
jgi:murein DD-endopeptidase MepM/ murein hydrolase activator NlpD